MEAWNGSATALLGRQFDMWKSPRLAEVLSFEQLSIGKNSQSPPPTCISIPKKHGRGSLGNINFVGKVSHKSNVVQLPFSQDLQIIAFDIKILGPAGSGCFPVWVSLLPMPPPLSLSYLLHVTSLHRVGIYRSEAA